jgi:hypothetical protein
MGGKPVQERVDERMTKSFPSFWAGKGNVIELVKKYTFLHKLAGSHTPLYPTANDAALPTADKPAF